MRTLRFYVLTTDRGPNEVLAKKYWMVLCRDNPKIVCLHADCNEHLAHLITLQSLKTCDNLLKKHGRDWKLFSSLATSSNTLRDVSKAFFQEWCNQHGDRSGVELARRLWPKCIGGRWNSIYEVVCRMFGVGGQAMLLPVLAKVLSKTPDSSKLPENNKPVHSVDELSVDQMKEYQKKWVHGE